MKNWMTPEVEELNVADTQYGGKVVTRFDQIFQNEETGIFEGTFES